MRSSLRTLGVGLVALCLLTAEQAEGLDALRPLPDQTAIDEVLEGAARPNPRYVSARAVEHYLRGRVAVETGLESADEQLSLAAVYDPQSAWPRYAIARNKLAHGLTAEAEISVRIALQVDEDHVPSLLLRARLLSDKGDLEGAVFMLSKASQADVSDPRPLVLLTRVLAESARLESAQETMTRLDEVLALQGGAGQSAREAAANASSMLAQALQRAGRDGDAEYFFLRSLQMTSPTVARMDAYVAFLEARERPEEAARLVAKTLAYAPPDAPRVLHAARLHLAAKRSDAAVAYVPLLTSVSNANDSALVELGASLLKGGDAARALVAFEAALSLAPDSRDARGYEAMALEVLGEFEKAILSYQEVSSDETVGEWARARAASCERRLSAEAVLRGTQVAESTSFIQASTAETGGAILSP